MSTYSEKLKDPRWQKKRLEILSRDDFRCQHCHHTDKTLHVHHLDYLPGKDPWDYSNEYFLTLCVDCHASEEEDKKKIEEALLRSFRLRFKDDFSKDCLISSIKELDNFDYLMYLMWEVKDHPEELQQALVDLIHTLKPVPIPEGFFDAQN